jgi:cysteinyl-tRNA synthetase
MGTSGTLMGASRRLKEYNPEIRIVGVEPYLGHKIQGLKNLKEAYRPGIFEGSRLDKKINIDDEEAFEMTRKLARHEGLFVGMSSGAAMVIACKEAELIADGIIVVIFPDGGERYLSTPLFTVSEKVDFKLFNTLSRSKEPFEPIVPGKVSIYSCGPTAHARMQLGECRRFVFADLLCRYLDYRNYSVKHVINITDLDDKTIDGSEREGMSLSEFTGKHIDSFKKDLDLLNVKPADNYPLASEHVDDMIALSEKLFKKGYAYEKLRSLYFDISRFPAYGNLSGIDINKIKIGATVDLDEYEKDNPRDFTLLKRAKLSELKRGIYVKTDWGNVRPSWHIQCAAIAMKYLGESFDIHTSGRELVFPHHENEIAITAGVTGKPLAKYWIHCDQVMMDSKMLSATGNKLTLGDLTRMGASGREIRFLLLSTHYRKPITFSFDRLENAKRSLNRLGACITNLQHVRQGPVYPELDQLLYDIKQGFISAMDDDLNISAALASTFKIARKINGLIREQRMDRSGALKIVEAFRNINSVLNILDFSDKKVLPDIENLIKEREKARLEKNWELADSIREKLLSHGIVIRDQKR